MTHPEIDIRPLAESGLLAVLGDAIDPATNARALALAAALEDASVPGVTDVVPAYVAVLVAFDPELADGETVAAALRAIAARLPDAPELPTRERVIPVVYGGEAGPDLADVAAHTGLTPDEVIARHAAGAYRVASMGFSPGWGYLLGLPPELVTPRRSTPRTRVPRGSVAIGGAQTGVYSLDTPGGWNIVGHTAVPMFDPDAEDPFFLRPGDTVRFERVDPADMRRIADAVARSHRPHPARDPDARTLTVLSPGALVTVQDLGRPGYLRLGVTSGGALDRRALVLGNRLLGNDPGAAALECAMAGPTLRFDAPALIAVTGADLSPRLNGHWIPLWEPLAVRAGDVLSFAHPARPGHGLRCFVCVDGGIATQPVMGSRSTDLFGRIGGIDGQPLRAGETLPLGDPAPDPDRILRRRLAGVPPRTEDRAPIRAVIGPQQDRFTDAGIETFFSATWTVSPRSDRMGLRLSGPRVEHSRGADTISEGIAAGAVQVPGDGQPIALLPARQTAGGYPKIATVIGADLDRLGQLGPGDTLRFAAVDVSEARTITLAARAALGPDAVREVPRAVVVRPGVRADAAGWDEAATERIAAVAREHGITEVAVSAPGLTVRMALAARPPSFPSPRGERDSG